MTELATYSPHDTHLYIGVHRIQGFFSGEYLEIHNTSELKTLKIRIMTSSPSWARLKDKVGEEFPVIFRSGARNYEDLEINQTFVYKSYKVAYSVDGFPISELTFEGVPE